MAVLRFKQEFVEKATVAQGTIAENGDYTPGGTSWGEKVPCDAVLNNGSSPQIRLEDGTAVVFTYTLYLSTKNHDFSVGDKVRVTFRDNTQKVFLVKGVDWRQLQTKLYV